MPERGREAEGAPDAPGDIGQGVYPVRIRRRLDPRHVAQLRRQQMAAQDPLGVVVVLGVPPPPQDQRRLEDVAGVVHLALVGPLALR